MKITDIIIAPPQLGKQVLAGGRVTGLRAQGQPADGYRHRLSLRRRPAGKGDGKINVRIDGKQLLDPPDGYAEVCCTGLEVFIYWSNGQPQVGAKASGIHLANTKA